MVVVVGMVGIVVVDVGCDDDGGCYCVGLW